jgi:hypothetical protein
MGNAELIDQQPELKWYMRGFLVDFLVEIHLQHRLRPETLYLAINIVDRYVSKRIVFKKHYQLVGCAALWIAAKFEDAKDRVPTLPELVEMCSTAYDEKAFVQMEGHVLTTIQWVIGHPTSEAWLRLACVTNGIEDLRTQHVARFLMELTLFHREFISFYTSDIAMASLLLARYMLGKTRRVRFFLPLCCPVLNECLPLPSFLRNSLKTRASRSFASSSCSTSFSASTSKTSLPSSSKRFVGLQLLSSQHSLTLSPSFPRLQYSLPAYSRASTFAREWYLCGRRFQYNDYSPPSSLPSTPLRPLMRSSSSSAASSSSSIRADISSTPSRSDGGDSDTSLESESDEEEDDDESECESEPITPITPLPPVSDPFLNIEAHHMDSYSTASAPLKTQGHPGLPAVRQPLERASWEMNHQVVYPSSNTFHSSPSAYRP